MIKLTDEEGKDIWIAAMHIVFMRAAKDGGSFIEITGWDSGLRVKESPKIVVAAMAAIIAYNIWP